MVRLVDEVLRSPRFGQHAGLASPTVTVADPATGTGTYVLAVLRKIAETVEADEGAGAVQQAIKVPASMVNDFLNLTTGGIRGKLPDASSFENELQTLAAKAVVSTRTN